MSDVQVFNGITRRWLGDAQPVVAALVENTFWETRELDGAEYYQTFENHIYRRATWCDYCVQDVVDPAFAPYCSAVCAGHARRS